MGLGGTDRGAFPEYNFTANLGLRTNTSFLQDGTAVTESDPIAEDGPRLEVTTLAECGIVSERVSRGEHLLQIAFRTGVIRIIVQPLPR